MKIATYGGDLWRTMMMAILIYTSFLLAPAWAGRYVLNQTPTTLRAYFGEPINTAIGGRETTYTYDHTKLRQLFPASKAVEFRISYEGDRAQFIDFDVEGSGNVEEAFDLKRIQLLYAYVFGYESPIFKVLSVKFVGDTIHDYVYCLGDGVAASFTLGGYSQFLMGNVRLFYEPRCEPPYQS